MDGGQYNQSPDVMVASGGGRMAAIAEKGFWLKADEHGVHYMECHNNRRVPMDYGSGRNAGRAT